MGSCRYFLRRDRSTMFKLVLFAGLLAFAMAQQAEPRKPIPRSLGVMRTPKKINPLKTDRDDEDSDEFGQPGCVNTWNDAKCERKEGKGQCSYATNKKNAWWVRRNCKKSCGICSDCDSNVC